MNTHYPDPTIVQPIRRHTLAIIVDNGVVKNLFVEAPMEFKVSSAENVLANL